MRSRKFGPKTVDHPSMGTPCPACNIPFKEGDYTALIDLGPGASEENRQRCKEGRFYNAVSIEVHWECSEDAYESVIQLEETNA